MKTKIFIALCCWASISFAQEKQETVNVLDRGVPQKSDKEFQFIALFYNQYVTSNYFPTNDFLRGQIFGRLFGQNTTTTSATQTTAYFEQRFLPFFIYTPKLMNGKVIFRASFEIDYTWGDVAYGTGGNFGGGLSADQVNLQTQNIQLEYIPAKRWAINLGLQRMFDNPSNAYRTLFDQLTNTGYRLTYWGTDATGINVRYDGDFQKLKMGYWKFYENSIQKNDDVNRWEIMYERDLSRNWKLGFSADYVMDRANGDGGPSILGQGLNSTLADYNGVFRFPLGGNPYRADVFWLGSFWTRNADYSSDRFMLTGFANYNFGRVDTAGITSGDFGKRASIGGLGANLKTGYRYGRTAGDVVQADIIYTSGDANGINDNRYSGVMTGNNWGSPVSIFISHGAYILFPHGNVVNRFVSAVNDPSNLGYGVTGAVFNAHKDLIPHKLNAKVGGAFALSNVAPGGGGFNIGQEANFRISYAPKVFMNIELHAAYLWLGDFYDSPTVNGNAASRPANPWTAFIVYRWLMF